MGPADKEISVIIPTYNRAKSLGPCLEHLLKQTIDMDRYEIIVVDDGSSDDTAEVIKEYQNHNQLKIKYLRQKNRGPAAARNRGAGNACGEILFFIDDDCLAQRETLEKISAEFRLPGRKNAVLGGFKTPGGKNLIGRAVDLACADDNWVNSRSEEVLFLPASNLALSKSLFLGENGFNEGLRSGEDSEWCLRMREKGRRMIKTPAIVVEHRHQRNNLYGLIRQTFLWGKDSDPQVYLKFKKLISANEGIFSRVGINLYFLSAGHPNLFFIFLFAGLAPLIAFAETLSLSLRAAKSRKKTLLLSPLFFLRALSRQAGYTASLLRQRRIANHKNSRGLRQLLYFNLKRKFNTPPYLVLFVTNNCNAACGHCFYWQRTVEKKEELPLEEYAGLAGQLGLLEKISLTGGEPFLRDDLPKIAEVFYRENRVKHIGITSNGLDREKICGSTEKILQLCPQANLGICLGLDGMKKSHDRARGVENGFDRLTNTYQGLKSLKARYPRLKISFNFTLTENNAAEFIPLYELVRKDFPECHPLTFSVLRSNPATGCLCAGPREPTLDPPGLTTILQLAQMIQKDLSAADKAGPGLYLQEACFGHTLEILRQKKQLVPCLMGRLYAVIDERANVYFCDFRGSIGNLKEREFAQIWNSQEAKKQRRQISSRQCYCYHNFFQDLNLRYQLLNPRVFFQAMGKFRRWKGS
jgi:glycosyltransferase involved in cell wall biosynthesis/MoaA/NifB/PqqE/SkfB family radical SAM enzyme